MRQCVENLGGDMEERKIPFVLRLESCSQCLFAFFGKLVRFLLYPVFKSDFQFSGGIFRHRVFSGEEKLALLPVVFLDIAVFALRRFDDGEAHFVPVLRQVARLQ